MQELKDFEVYILDKILKETDFEKIQRMMNAIEWGWYNGESLDSTNCFTVPTILQLKTNAIMIINDLLIDIRSNKDYCYHETGGLYVWYNKYNSDKWYENIVFDFKITTTLYFNEIEKNEIERLEKLNNILSYINKKED